MGFSSIILIVIIGVGIWFFLKKRKEKNSTNEFQSNRRNKDEVWKTIKQFLKDNDEYGKEISESYVVKRNHIDYIDPNLSKAEKKVKKDEIKLRNSEFKKQQKLQKAKKDGKAIKKPDVRDLYVVAFTTRDSKTKKTDTPRVIECEVINKKISKKEWDRQIVINGELNYDVEMEWVAPIKAAEMAKNAKIEAKNEEIKAKKERKAKDKAIKKQKRVNDKNAKNK